MFDKIINGRVKAILGLSNGQYRISTKYSRFKGQWILHIESNKKVWNEFMYQSEFEADQAANDYAIQISRGEFYF